MKRVRVINEHQVWNLDFGDQRPHLLQEGVFTARLGDINDVLGERTNRFGTYLHVRSKDGIEGLSWPEYNDIIISEHGIGRKANEKLTIKLTDRDNGDHIANIRLPAYAWYDESVQQSLIDENLVGRLEEDVSEFRSIKEMIAWIKG